MVFFLPCRSSFNYSFISPNIFFIFLVLFCFLFFDIVLLLVFFLSSFYLFYFYCATKLAGSWFPGWRSGRAPVVGALSPNHWTNREPQTPGNVSWSEASQRSSSQHQDPALSNCLQTPVLDTSGQTTSKTAPPIKKKQKKCYGWRSKVRWNMLQMKEQWRQNWQPTWKRIQNNDSKDDPKSWK